MIDQDVKRLVQRRGMGEPPAQGAPEVATRDDRMAGLPDVVLEQLGVCQRVRLFWHEQGPGMGDGELGNLDSSLDGLFGDLELGWLLLCRGEVEQRGEARHLAR
ncbi:MAG: hypothetical protein U0821_27175 [Chloroflexota bacterium]